ncbi:Pimeloyl-ACP methyl ester carboxylesterase [Sphingopyxis sp. YR583]|uniref:alpha/beta fold hydrolase n=1 Tax=Sphingopyxis sp. YR583 TaxID=1881047 RepID=UPI0008A7D1B1|nr:alpha/beta hydrolase [Sphingopyxis sp. YR583]SEH19923.1 Pimeloyl-ACP methyl ester carboxylesterase [Sphingopyxis sp. YR583]
MSNHDKSRAWRSGICRANGIDIHYLRTGGNKPPLVVLHGLIGSGACLSPLAQVLEDHFDVILPDARGHGESSAPEQGYLYPNLADDIIGLVAELGLEAPILAGHSMGGMTAALAASKLRLAIEALVLIDPTFISPEWQREVYESDIAADHRQLLQTSRDELIAQARLRNPSRSIELTEFLADARFRTCMSAFEVLTPPNPDWRALIRNIDVPVLLLTGDRGVVSPETAQELANLNPSLRHELIADAGHGLPYDMPAQSGAAMLDFLLKLAIIRDDRNAVD